VRTIGWLMLVLVCLCWIASELPISGDQDRNGWRRTRIGWEHQEKWPTNIVVREPALHPTTVGSLQLLLSLMALVAFPAQQKAQDVLVQGHRATKSSPHIPIKAGDEGVSDEHRTHLGQPKTSGQP